MPDAFEKFRSEELTVTLTREQLEFVAARFQELHGKAKIDSARLMAADGLARLRAVDERLIPVFYTGD